MELQGNERVELEGAASYREEPGILYLTDTRLVFYSLKSKRQLAVMRHEVRGRLSYHSITLHPFIHPIHVGLIKLSSFGGFIG
jgi:hypothetical protein